ncbi:head GIN domain-containing protein [Psychroserpens damuponensis]|uniref:head GIN domain-containing protein n=1 Tax=Psychroserpens damuponensis TaxID=943936 RepID=UPI00058AE926|nr:head GIN domain-containing protein [Psychroserpens damuponensis]
MRKLIGVIFTMVLLSCNGEHVPDCFQNAGDLIEREFEVDVFTQITAYPRIELIITAGETQNVMVQTGEYLMNDIEVKVVNGRLELYNNNGCNLTRDYALTKVFVTTPNLSEIRNGSGRTVSSLGVLNFDNLTLISEDSNDEDAFSTDGNFDLEVDANFLRVVVNNLSNVVVDGEVNNLKLEYYSGDARFEGRDLMAQNVTIFQRSSNDMIINAQQSITGEIRSTGDVILVHTPPIIDVEQFYTGQLIFED